jgi:glycosyltransferase involved in cell wall biosynthesis
MQKVYIITATVGTEFLDICIQSVQQQIYTNIEHVVVCDGKEHVEKVNIVLEKYKDMAIPISVIVLPWNSGRNKYICHKIYASIPHLLHGPAYVNFLDEDNFIEPTHISSMIETIQKENYLWTYCLRNVVGKKNQFICKDICESLGSLSMTWLSEFNRIDYLVDTSCYLVPLDILQEFSICWQRPARSTPEADRLFYKELSHRYKNYGCTMKFTLNYRIDGRPDSVKADFFMLGNSKIRSKYKEAVPWDL